MIITPAFTFFTFGPVNGCCIHNNKITISYKYSWLNVFFTTVIYIMTAYIVIDYFCLTRTDKISFCLRNNPELHEPVDRTIVELLFYSIYLFGIVAFFLLQIIDNCTSFCYNYDCCNNHMLPFTQRSVLDINNTETDNIVYLNDFKDKRKQLISMFTLKK